MDNFSSEFIAQMSYLKEKKCKNLEQFPLGAFWGNFGIFWGICWFLEYFQNLIFFYFL
jgi:hypothetical protein